MSVVGELATIGASITTGTCRPRHQLHGPAGPRRPGPRITFDWPERGRTGPHHAGSSPARSPSGPSPGPPTPAHGLRTPE
ncbi:hypothetical protein ACRAWF_17460 [Streptomyces sp. L7]